VKIITALTSFSANKTPPVLRGSNTDSNLPQKTRSLAPAIQPQINTVLFKARLSAVTNGAF